MDYSRFFSASACESLPVGYSGNDSSEMGVGVSSGHSNSKSAMKNCCVGYNGLNLALSSLFSSLSSYRAS
jgi:hypothetical protein